VPIYTPARDAARGGDLARTGLPVDGDHNGHVVLSSAEGGPAAVGQCGEEVLGDLLADQHLDHTDLTAELVLDAHVLDVDAGRADGGEQAGQLAGGVVDGDEDPGQRGGTLAVLAGHPGDALAAAVQMRGDRPVPGADRGTQVLQPFGEHVEESADLLGVAADDVDPQPPVAAGDADDVAQPLS